MTQAKDRYSRESVIAAYQRIGNVRGTCAETGCSPYVAVIWLTKAGVLKTSDRANYGSAESKRGGLAEREFQRLVPAAVSANATVADNNPSFDFMLGECSIDVKFAGLRDKWGWRMPGGKALQPDFVVVFLSADRDVLDAGYRLLLIPTVLYPEHRTMSLTPSNGISPFWDFEIAPGDLAATLEDAA